jgi:hypothetical protein
MSISILNSFDNNTQINYDILPFQDNYVRFASDIYKCCPEYLVLNLYDIIIDEDKLFEMITNLLHNMSIILNIGSEKFIELPLRLLWELKKPYIVDNKIYLYLPFNSYFGDIYVSTDPTIHLYHNSNLINYVASYDLLCKIIKIILN